MPSALEMELLSLGMDCEAHTMRQQLNQRQEDFSALLLQAASSGNIAAYEALIVKV